jgi:hypothetical protein
LDHHRDYWRQSVTVQGAAGAIYLQEFCLPICATFFSIYTTAGMILAGHLHTDVWAVWAGFSGLVAISSMVVATFIFFDEPLPMSASGTSWRA